MTGTEETAGTDLVVVGASAGGVEALRTLVAGLPSSFPAPVVIVLHIPAQAPSALAAILDRAGPLTTVTAREGDPLRAGFVYVAPADHHVLVEDGVLRLTRGPAENGHRPAIDPLFRSAALARGAGVVGVILSGTRDDGTAGLVAIAEHGGLAVVQDPDDALFPVMPASALAHVPTAASHPAAKIGAALTDLLAGHRPVPATRPDAPDVAVLAGEVAVAGGHRVDAGDLPGAQPSGLSCLACGGDLYEVPGEPGPRFRCRVGHAWSPDSLGQDQRTAVEEALWTAVRTLQERAELLRRLAEHARSHGRAHGARQHEQRARAVEAKAAVVRGLLAEPDGDGSE